MTPLGHAGIAYLVGIGITKAFPALDAASVVTATTLGGVAPDLDLLYRYIQTGGGNILDKTIGKHRYLPSHTPFFLLSFGAFLTLISLLFSKPPFAVSIWFFVLGTMIHLFLDTLFFPEGVNFTFPMDRKMTRLFYIKTHPFWAPKPISQVDGWWKNYLRSPVFLVFEIFPTFVSFVILFWQTLN